VLGEESSSAILKGVEDTFLFSGVIAVLTGVYLIWHRCSGFRYVRRDCEPTAGFYSPRVALLCPCKGVESGLERNLVPLTEFERPKTMRFFSFSLWLGPRARHHRSAWQELARESQCGDCRGAQRLQREVNN